MMMYSVSHYLRLWILPPGFNLLLVFLGYLFLFYSRTLGRICIFSGFISLWMLSTPFVAYGLMDYLQDQYPLLSSNLLNHPQSHSAIVVLGGGDSIEKEYGNKHTVSNFTLHRVNYAAYLHKKMKLPIILSGGKSLSDVPDSEADLMATVLRDNFNITTWLKEDKSLTTVDESKFLRPILKNNNIKTIYLVTNAWHMPRSVFIFECAGIDVIPAPMGYLIYGPGYSFISFLPNIDALYASSLAIHELIGLFWYHAHYGNHCVSK